MEQPKLPEQFWILKEGNYCLFRSALDGRFHGYGPDGPVIRTRKFKAAVQAMSSLPDGVGEDFVNRLGRRMSSLSVQSVVTAPVFPNETVEEYWARKNAEIS